MSTANVVLGQLNHLLEASAARELSDRQLLDRFVRQQDQHAFGTLVKRHGPLVLGVCRRVLGQVHDAEDAFQATFLVLARRAADLCWQESISCWLHEVAYRTARKALGSLGRQRAHERQAAAMPRPEPIPESDLRELGEVLDEEIQALPEKFRAPLVLCYLEGLSREEAAERLGISLGAVKDRLERGRELLRKRLAHRGLTTASALFVADRALPGLAPIVPPHLIQGTIEAGVAYAATTAAGTAGAAVSDSAARLAEGVLTTMTMTKSKLLTLLATLLVLGVTVGLGAYASRPGKATTEAPAAAPQGVPPQVPPAEVNPPALAARADDEGDERKNEREHVVEGIVLRVEAAQNRIVLREDEDDKEMTVTVTATVPCTVCNQPGSLADLRKDMLIRLSFKKEGDAEPVKVSAGWRSLTSDIKNIDVTGNKLSVEIEAQEGVAFEVPLAVIPGASITIDELKGSLADLAGRKKVFLELSVDKKSITKVEAEANADEIIGQIQGVDPEKGEIIVELEIEGGKQSRRIAISFPLAKDAKVRISGKEAQAIHLLQDMPALLKLGKDRRTVENVLADQPRPRKNDDD